MDDIERMASSFYGFGSWNAQYWFIGPEQGQGRDEDDDLSVRAEVFAHLDVDGLSDCREFHLLLNASPRLRKPTRWHIERRPPLQRTWRRLMLLLLSYIGAPSDELNNSSLRKYQRESLGSRSGQTCLIELSGLAANNLAVARERELFRQPRIDFIKRMLEIKKPRFVVIYGKSQWKHWEKALQIEGSEGGVEKVGETMVAFALQPTAPRQTDQVWKDLGRKLRELSSVTQ